MMVMLATSISCQHRHGAINTKVKIENQKWYADKGELGAVQFQTMNNQKLEVEKEAWDSVRFGMVCSDPDVFGAMEKNIRTLCSLYGYCDYPDIQQTMNTLRYMRRMGHSSFSQIKSREINLDQVAR